MADYSLDFLRTDWDGAGYDFEFCCVFQPDHVDLGGLKTLLAKSSARFVLRRFKYLINPGDEYYIVLDEDISAGDIKNFPNMMDEMPSEFFAWFSALDDENAMFCVRFLYPDEFEIGSYSEYYYTGSKTGDRARVENVVELLFLATEMFGDAFGEFAAEGFVIEMVREYMAKGKSPNITADADRTWWIDTILHKLEDSRPSRDR